MAASDAAVWGCLAQGLAFAAALADAVTGGLSLAAAACEGAATESLFQGLDFAAVLALAATVGAVVGAGSASLLQGLGVEVAPASAAAFAASGVLVLLPQPPSDSARAELMTNRIDRLIIDIFPEPVCAIHSAIRSSLSTR
ncbi:hypothetical protein KRR38_07630 [Novosphingobium sp. G106]|uniref:hypothetical protein n=1 Tax=Novosphingobium sp. G106 TaxID=2849500 RepID=UPI001C2D28F5|nr:hypothetical protein [Novosphingobium sp. G106]